jgi:hypothetical protein
LNKPKLPVYQILPLFGMIIYTYIFFFFFIFILIMKMYTLLLLLLILQWGINWWWEGNKGWFAMNLFWKNYRKKRMGKRGKYLYYWWFFLLYSCLTMRVFEYYNELRPQLCLVGTILFFFGGWFCLWIYIMINDWLIRVLMRGEKKCIWCFILFYLCFCFYFDIYIYIYLLFN